MYWLGEMEKIIEKLLNENTSLYINQNEHYRAKVETETREDEFTIGKNKYNFKNFEKVIQYYKN